MKKIPSLIFVIILLTTLFAPRYAMAASQYSPHDPFTNFSQQATVNYGAWMTGANSTFDVLLSEIIDTTVLSNGYYPGWCIEPEITGDLHDEPATIYSSLNSALPSDIADLPWGKVNYVLNHKIRGDGKGDAAFFLDVSDAIQVLLGKKEISRVSVDARQMVDEGNAHAGFVPAYGDIVAFIVYTDGVDNTDGNYYQEVIIEVRWVPPPTQTPTETPSPTETNTGTPPVPTDTPTITPTPTETTTATPPTDIPTVTPTSTVTPTVSPTATITPTETPPVCVPVTITVDFTQFAPGASVEGMGVVAPGLNIDASGTAVRIQEGVQPAAYGASNENPVLNGALASTGGFSDMSTKDARQAHQYTFTFAPGTSVAEFSLRMLDYGDFNPSGDLDHYVSMTAYDVNDVVVSMAELSYTADANLISTQYGNLRITGDAVTGLPGQPGNWTWQVSGNGIVRVVLDFGAGYDPYIGFDLLSYTIECP